MSQFDNFLSSHEAFAHALYLGHECNYPEVKKEDSGTEEGDQEDPSTEENPKEKPQPETQTGQSEVKPAAKVKATAKK